MPDVAEAPESVATVEETTTVTTAPESPDPTSPLGAAGEEPAPTGTEPTGSAQPRDAHGRFTAKSQDPTDAGPVAETTTAPAPPTPAPTTPPGEPFTFRAEGQRIPIQGATLAADGALMIPADQVPAIRQLLSEGVTYRSSWRKERDGFQSQLAEVNKAAKATSQKYNRASVLLWDRVSQLLSDNPQELELLRRELDLELRSADLNIPKAPAAPQEAAPDPQQIENAARSVLSEYIEELLERPQAKAVYDTPEKRQALTARLQRRIGAYFVNHEGSVNLHENAVDADFEEELKDRLAAKEEVEKARKAAEFNAKRNNPAPAVPPVVSTKAPPAPPPTPTKYESREDWRRKQGMP